MTYYTLLSKDWKEVASSYNKEFLVTYAYFVSTSINRDDIYQLVPWTTSRDYKKHNLRNVEKGIGIRYFRGGRDVTQECIDKYLKIQRKWDELEESHEELYMDHYKLIEFHWWSDTEREIASGTDQELLVKDAVSITTPRTGDPYTCTCRLEKWVDGRCVGGWRFFQNGREFTQDIIYAITKDWSK